MRIVLLAPFAVYGPKGTTRWRVLPLARALAAAGHAVRIVAPPYDYPAHSGRRWREGQVQVINVAVRPGLSPWQVAEAASRLQQAAFDWQPDVIHAFKPVGVAGLAAVGLLLRPGAPPVVVDADDWEAGWVAQQNRGVVWQRLVSWQEQWVLRRADAVTVASRWLWRWVAGQRPGAGAPSLAGERERVFYVPNGAEFTQAAPTHPRPGNGKRVLLYTRFVEHSPAQVWSVWRRVVAAQPDACLWVAGRGLRGEEAELLALARAAELGHTVRWLGWAPAPSRAGLFAAVDAALLPVADTPLNRAKCPMRLVDLLAAGVPVATQAVGEYAAYVQDGLTGLLTPAGDDEALAKAVLWLLRDAELRAALAAGAVQRMQLEFSWQRLAQVAVQAYHATQYRPTGV